MVEARETTYADAVKEHKMTLEVGEPALQTDGDGWRHYAYECTLRSGEGQTAYVMRIPYRMGLAHVERTRAGLERPRKPTAVEVFGAIYSDAWSYEQARSFEEWANEFGYDTDSRTAEKMYRAISEQVKHVKGLLGLPPGAELPLLQEED